MKTAATWGTGERTTLKKVGVYTRFALPRREELNWDGTVLSVLTASGALLSPGVSQWLHSSGVR